MLGAFLRHQPGNLLRVEIGRDGAGAQHRIVGLREEEVAGVQIILVALAGRVVGLGAFEQQIAVIEMDREIGRLPALLADQPHRLSAARGGETRGNPRLAIRLADLGADVAGLGQLRADAIGQRDQIGGREPVVIGDRVHAGMRLASHPHRASAISPARPAFPRPDGPDRRGSSSAPRSSTGRRRHRCRARAACAPGR